MSLLSIMEACGDIKQLLIHPSLDHAKKVIATARLAIEEVSDHYRCAKEQSLEYLNAISLEHSDYKHELFKYYVNQSSLVASHLKHEQFALIFGSMSLEGGVSFSEAEFKLVCQRTKAPVTFFESQGSHYMERALQLGSGFDRHRILYDTPLFHQVILDFKRSPVMVKTGGVKLYGSFNDSSLEEDVKGFIHHLRAQGITNSAVQTGINLIHQSHAAFLYGYLFALKPDGCVPMQSYGSYKIDFEVLKDRSLFVKYQITYLLFDNHINEELPLKFPCSIDFTISPDGLIEDATYHVAKFKK